MADRTQCVVPFCRRSCKASLGYAEYLCSKHWPMTDRKLRRIHFRVRRRIKAGRRDLDWLADRIWERLKEQAILRA